MRIIFKCKILKNCNAYCLDDYLTKYRLRNNSLQSNSFKNFIGYGKLIENLINLMYLKIYYL